jgi:WD40 repeat protein
MRPDSFNAVGTPLHKKPRPASQKSQPKKHGPVDGRVASGGDDSIIRVWDSQTGACDLTLIQPGPYEGLDINGAVGLSPAQTATLKALGAVV